MNQARAVSRYLRVQPRKMRLVIDTVRRKPAQEAVNMLTLMPKRAARFVREAIKSAMANAKVLKLNPERLVVAEIFADGGPSLKRFRSRAMGRASAILKRTTHLTVILRERDQPVSRPPAAAPAGKEKTAEKPPAVGGAKPAAKRGRKKVLAQKA